MIEQILCRQLQRKIRPCVITRTGVVAQRGIEGGKRGAFLAVCRVSHPALVVSEQRSSEPFLLPHCPDPATDLGREEQRAGQVVRALSWRQSLVTVQPTGRTSNRQPPRSQVEPIRP